MPGPGTAEADDRQYSEAAKADNRQHRKRELGAKADDRQRKTCRVELASVLGTLEAKTTQRDRELGYAILGACTYWRVPT